MIPAYFIRIDRIPLKPNGKLDRKALPAPQIEVRRVNYAAPENEVQEKLCTAMAGVLKLEQMGIHDDFYELGGDSLKAIELVSSCDLPGLSTAEIFQGRTPSKIAELYEKAQAENAEGSPETRNAEAMKKAHPLTTEQQYRQHCDGCHLQYHPESLCSHVYPSYSIFPDVFLCALNSFYQMAI